ncbi:T-cell immunomodulatory protein, partial [Tachysurus ichikawai]
GDGSQDHLLPVCMDEACTKSAIYLAKPGQPEIETGPSISAHQGHRF